MRDEDKTEKQLIYELSEQRHLNAELKNILATLIENLSEGIIVTDLNGQIIYANESAEKQTGYSRHELIGESPGKLNGEKDADTTQQEIVTTMQRSERWCRDLLQKRKDGSTYLAELEIFPVLDDKYTPLAWASIQRDTTKRRLVEDALQESEIKYRTLVEQIPAITYVAAIDEADTTLYVSPQVEKLSGYSQADYKADPDIRRRKLHPDDRERVLADLAHCHKGKDRFFSEYRMFAKDGRVLWFHDEATVIQDKTEKPLYLQGVMLDITYRKQMEEALRRSEQEKELILGAISDNVVLYDTEMKILWGNKSASETFGALPEQYVGRYCYEFKRKLSSPCPGCYTKKALDTGKFQEGELTTPDGRTFFVRSYPIKNDNADVTGIVEVSQNITKPKQMEQEMARMERLNLVGEMAAAIGHEVRNPMTTVRGFLQLLVNKQVCSNYKEYFNIMIDELDRANSIITEFLSLARNRPVDLSVHNLNTILNTLSPLITANANNSSVNVVSELGDIPDLALNEKEIRQAILNLFHNGIEAMEQGGELTIRTFTDNGEVVLSVQDHGPGIKPELMDKIGTPFFTTKEMGTGLGLAVCYGIAARHNAAITIDTGPEGTTFFMRFKLGTVGCLET